MSKIAIKGATTGTGVFTLESPATNTDRTLVLPDEAGTVLTTAGVPASAMPAGSVIQVLQAVKTSTASFTSANSNTFVDLSGLSVSITPTSATSKILVLFSVNVGQSTTATIHVRLVRDSTSIYVGDSEGNRLQDSAIQRSADVPYSLEIGNLNGSFLDSPATTSTLTYKIQGTLGSSYNGTFYLNRSSNDANADYGGRTASSITVMEIAG